MFSINTEQLFVGDDFFPSFRLTEVSKIVAEIISNDINLIGLIC